MRFRRAVATFACAALLVVGSVAATMAYLTSQDAVTNTFTVGNVKIHMDETDVDGSKTNHATCDYCKKALDSDQNHNRDHANSYTGENKLVPGHTYVKDPKVTVLAGSEKSYIRMLVTVENIDQLKASMSKERFPSYYAGDLFLLQMLCVDENDELTWDDTQWLYESYTPTTVGEGDEAKDCGVYEFRYYDTVNASGSQSDVPLTPLFTDVTIPGEIDNDQIAGLADVEIVVTAHAIQADGFDSADEAWGAFDVQNV